MTIVARRPRSPCRLFFKHAVQGRRTRRRHARSAQRTANLWRTESFGIPRESQDECFESIGITGTQDRDSRLKPSWTAWTVLDDM
jgi:hypothetical protein